MHKIMPSALGVAIMLCASSVFAATYTIPVEQVDSQKVYWGAPSGFDKAGEVRYDEIVKATPEYRELKSVERGTGKYWILLSQASDRAVRAISQVGQSSDFDLITAKDYLAKLSPAIPAEDITNKVINKMNVKPGKQKAKVAKK